jgi:serine/threonine-protein kinase
VERYDILAKLAEGGMGEVLLARATGQHGFRKLVAVKRIKPELAKDPEFLVRFVTEAKVTVSLSHANVVQVFDLARSGDDLFLVMEYVRGADLALLLSRARELGETLSVPLVLHIAAEALKGLSYAHGRSRPGASGIIHCDLSPSNLLLSYSGEVKLADFGIAQAVARRQSPDGKVIGKKAYMSPEQRAALKLDGRTDLYSLGVVLKTALQVSEPEGAWPVSRVPLRLAELVDSMSAEEATERPTTAGEALKTVAEIGRLPETGTPLTAPEVGAWVARLVPPPPERDDEEFARALGQVLGAAPRTGTQSRQLSQVSAQLTFISGTKTDGTTVWVPAPLDEVPKKRRPLGLAAAAAATVVAVGGLIVGGWTWTRPKALPLAPAPVVQAPAEPVTPPAAPAPPAPQPPAPATVPAPPPVVTAHPGAPHTDLASSSRKNRRERGGSPGFLNVFAEPWANVVIDGRRVGTTPLRSVALAAGSHQIRLEHPARRPVEKAVVISSGRTELLDVDLEKTERAP